MATTWGEIRKDHLLRYEFAINELKRRGKTGKVIDAGCGVGYGSAMLADAVDSVVSIELSTEAHDIYRQHWHRPNIKFCNLDLLTYECDERVDAVVCFEFIEHVEFYDAAIERFSRWSDLLIISTPNEEIRPHLQEPVNPFHFRHFRPSELSEALAKQGFQVSGWHHQKNGAKPEIHAGTDGKFIIAIGERNAERAAA